MKVTEGTRVSVGLNVIDGLVVTLMYLDLIDAVPDLSKDRVALVLIRIELEKRHLR